MKISSRINKVDVALTRLALGQYSDVDIHWVCDSICWLYKYGHITKSEMSSFVNQAIDIFNLQKGNY